MTGISSVISDAPEVTVTNARPLEKDLYKKVWDMPEYRKVAPGEKVAHEFLAQAKPKGGASVLDLGCGTGRGGLNLAFFGGLDVTLVDFAPNCLDAVAEAATLVWNSTIGWVLTADRGVTIA